MEKIKSISHRHKLLGLLTGLIFGFLLQKGGVTDYNVLVGQLLLEDFTVFKVILTAIITGMIGVNILNYLGKVELSLKTGSVGSIIIGGLLFGVGFGLLGYCPGTVIGAVGQGSLDALIGGVPGMILGAGFFANIYPKVKNSFLAKQPIKRISIKDYFDINEMTLIFLFASFLIIVLLLIEFLL